MRVDVLKARLGWAAAFLLCFAAQAQAEDCSQPDPVCAARASVFAISAFDPVASAVRIGPATLVTSRHAVADEPAVTVFLADGSPLDAAVVPSDFEGDIVLLSVPDLPAGPVLEPAPLPKIGASVFSVGTDVGRRAVRAYPPGEVMILPADGHPLARLHHTAYSQPGNSGGALVTASGRLVGFIASGGEGRFEAVPAATLTALKARSGQEHAAGSAFLGAAIKQCTLLLEDRRGNRQALAPETASQIETNCLATGNRQYFDLAAEAFGSAGLLGASIAASEASLAQDPNSLNARMTAVVTYHLAGWYEEEIPHLKFLMRHIPDDPQVIRYGIQAGVWGGDPDLASAAFERLKASNPNMAPAAENFLKSPPPRPPRRDLAQ